MIFVSTLTVLPFPIIDPVIVHVGPLAIRWYSLAYIFGLILGWKYILRLLSAYGPAVGTSPKERRRSAPPMSKEDVDDFLLWAVIGIVIGGRLGYILFYKAGFYFEHPAEMLMVWRGGMSFHGGFLGFSAALAYFAQRRGLSFLGISDLMACAAPIGLFLGRIANFINAELYGRATNVPWAMVFPTGGPEPRHPSQLYEAFLEGVILFLVIRVFFHRPRWRENHGAVTGVFLIGYAGARIVAELFRQPDAYLGFLIGEISMGQLLSFPMAILGFYLIFRSGVFQKKIV